jgi:hypothetical protein
MQKFAASFPRTQSGQSYKKGKAIPVTGHEGL